MAQKNAPTSSDVTRVTSRHMRVYFYMFVFGAFFFFYPGDSLYTRLFSHQRDMFMTPPQQTLDFKIDPVPYVLPEAYTPVVSAHSVYVIDIASATPLVEKNIHARLYPASTTKVITALTAIDTYPLDRVLRVRRVMDEGQTMGLVQGEQMTVENLLYGVLVQSGNDAAYVLADNNPGGYKGFVDSMNEKARSLKMMNSNFQNPAGLDNALQYSTVFDLALAGRELLRHPVLSKMVSIKSITVSDVDYIHFHSLYNVNRLLGEIPGVAGLKTGKTDLAGENLITLFKHQGHEYLIVMMKSEDRFTDTTTLVEWIKNSVRYMDPEKQTN